MTPGWAGRPSAFLLLVPLALVVGCAGLRASSPDPAESISISDGWLAMGTFFEVELRVHPRDEARARTWMGWARNEIERLERLYSRHDPSSAISALNRQLAMEDALVRGARVEAELESILFDALEVWEGTGGAFDITIGPLVELWTRAAEEGRWPSVEALRSAKRHVGSEGLLLLGAGEIGLANPAMRLDLDGLSKGAVLDRLRERLARDLPHAAALFSFGESSILAIGDPGGGAWQLVVRPAGSTAGPPLVVLLRDQAISASSSTGSVSQIGDERVSHVVDPRTGSAVAETVEAIVIAERAVIADGWSTGLLVIGAQRSAHRLLDRAGIDARISDSSGRVVTTERFGASLAK